jgi:short subunit fatty acids transporter
MNTRFKVFASYNILNICVILSMFLYLYCLEMPKKSQINEYSDILV